MKPNTINFTKSTLNNLPLPKKHQGTSYKDTQVKGLIVSVRKTGTKSFFLYKKVEGKPERFYLGRYPDLSIDNARKLAQVKLGEIAIGRNPPQERREKRQEMTLGQLIDKYMEQYSKPQKKTWRADELQYKLFFSHWRDGRISQIKRSDIKELMDKYFAERGVYQANKALERICALYSKAIEWGWPGANPAATLKRFRVKSRERFIQPGEMPHVLQALYDEPNQHLKDFIWLLLLTGARKTNTMMMRWEELNWEWKEWRIPDTKNGDALIVPLVDQAIEILQRRYECSDSQWVFPSPIDNATHIVVVDRGWKRLLRRATLLIWRRHSKVSEWVCHTEKELSRYYEDEDTVFCLLQKEAKTQNIALPTGVLDVRLHDLRRTFGSYQAMSGSSLQVIGKSLGHKSVQATQIYARLTVESVRDSIEKGMKAMLVA